MDSMVSSSSSPQETMQNLEDAEKLLLKVLEISEQLVKSLDCEPKDFNRDAVASNGVQMLDVLEELRERITREIPKLVMYMHFERSCYGAKRDFLIAQQKLQTAKDSIRKIQKDLEIESA